MNNYELTIIIDGKATPAKKKALIDKIEKFIKTLEGKILKFEDWGKRDFAYKVKKGTSGNYLFFNIELKANLVKSLREKLRLDGEVVRYLLIRV